MNKKGFTLVELLAVIAILAILAVVATTSVPSLLKSTKSKSFMTEVQTIYNQAKTDYLIEDLTSTGTVSFDSTSKKLNVDTKYTYYVTVDKGVVTQLHVVGTNGYYYTKSNSLSAASDITADDVKEVPSGKTCTASATAVTCN